jgi:hypothetical protein
VGDPFIDLINFDLASLRNHISKLNLASRIDHPCILPRSGVGAGSLSAEQLDIALLGAFYGILDKAHDQVFSVVFSCEHCRHRVVSVGQRSPVQSGLDISLSSSGASVFLVDEDVGNHHDNDNQDDGNWEIMLVL